VSGGVNGKEQSDSYGGEKKQNETARESLSEKEKEGWVRPEGSGEGEGKPVSRQRPGSKRKGSTKGGGSEGRGDK